MAQPAQRNVTSRDREIAARLKRLYNKKRLELEMTQASLGKLIGLEQTTVSQYLNAYLPLNLEGILKFARALQVDPTEIDPDLKDRYAILQQVEVTKISVLGTFSGTYPAEFTVHVRGTKYMPHHLAVVVDTDDLYPAIGQGAVIIIDPHTRPKERDRIVVRLRGVDGYRLYRLREINSKSLVVTAFDTVDNHDLIEAEHFPKKPRRFPLQDVSEIFKVAGIQFE